MPIVQRSDDITPQPKQNTSADDNLSVVSAGV
jgi:hypothetical protein